MRNHEGSCIAIVPLDSTGSSDRDLEDLLKLVYVGGGYTETSLAETLFNGASVRARGSVLVARDAGDRLVGSVVVVPAGSPACRFATAGEAELHLLCVRPDQQGRGVGSELVSAALEVARKSGATRMILWTQPSMTVARALYTKHGFTRLPSLDFARGDRMFQVFTRPI